MATSICSAKTKSVALILASPKDTEGWPREIALGMQQACDELGYELYIEDEVAVGSDACPQVIEKLEVAYRRDERVLRFITVKNEKYAAAYAEKRRNKKQTKED